MECPNNYRQINMDWDIFIIKYTTLLLGALHLTQAFSQDGVLLSKYGCEGELVKIDCDTSLVIDIVRANYGRLSPQVCAPLANQEGSGQDCLHRSSKAVLDRQCAGNTVVWCELPQTSFTTPSVLW